MAILVTYTTKSNDCEPIVGPGVIVIDSDGKPSVDTVLSALFTALASKPEVPNLPVAQDIVDALLTLGLVTQAAPVGP